MNNLPVQKLYDVLRAQVKYVYDCTVGPLKNKCSAYLAQKGVGKMVREKAWKMVLLVILLLITEAAQWLICLILAKAGIDVCRKKLF